VPAHGCVLQEGPELCEGAACKATEGMNPCLQRNSRASRCKACCSELIELAKDSRT